MIGEIYGKWKILGKIGGGGFSEVYLVEEILDPENRAALKIFKTRLSNEVFLREARNLKSLKHPNIVELIDYGIYPRPYIVMELMETNLKEYIERNPIDQKKAIDIWLQIAYAINYAHSRGIIHQDIKPENILIRNNVFKIGDFGISEIIKEKIREGIKESTIIEETMLAEPKAYGYGTIYWSAPEQLRGIIDKRNDIYSLAKLLHYLLTNGGLLPNNVTLEKLRAYNYPDEIKRLIVDSLKPLNQRIKSVSDQIAIVEMYSEKGIMKLVELGEKLFHERKFREAEKILRKVISLDPNNIRAYEILIQILSIFKRYSEAYNLCIKALELDRKNAELWNLLGLIFNAVGDPVRAKAAYEKALEIDPNNINALTNLGFIYYRFGKFIEAIKYLERALKVNPNDAMTWMNLSATLFKLKRVDEALNAIRKALELNPNWDEIWSNYGIMLLELGKINEAEEALRRALELNSNNSQSWYGYGVVQIHKGNYAEAERALRKSLEIDSTIPLVWEKLGKVLLILGKRSEAEMAFRKARELNQKLRMLGIK